MSSSPDETQGSGTPDPAASAGNTTSSQTTPSWDDIIDLSNKSLENKPPSATEITRPPGEASKETCKNILLKIQQVSKSKNIGDVTVSVSILLQKGATSPKTAGNQKSSWGSTTIDVEMIRNACKVNSVTVRQFARGMKDIVANQMRSLGNFGAKGNLSRKASLEIENMTTEEEIWASDFQTYNPNCPARVKKWLVKNFESRFSKE
uniref:Uncharacterized protein n=1 Tax=Pseudopediastrum integrum TaxID=271402 RepID=A0A2U8GJG1_9CHLO|nr:hypothetical protein [Pseudopediastrum integrum]AWI68802.1 hypothetical protein [Pseudopediastrum integrum]